MSERWAHAPVYSYAPTRQPTAIGEVVCRRTACRCCVSRVSPTPPAPPAPPRDRALPAGLPTAPHRTSQAHQRAAARVQPD
eukprot:3787485-Prymnesium_polylepis.2